jgi:hypothetical protein
MQASATPPATEKPATPTSPFFRQNECKKGEENYTLLKKDQPKKICTFAKMTEMNIKVKSILAKW